MGLQQEKCNEVTLIFPEKQYLSTNKCAGDVYLFLFTNHSWLPKYLVESLVKVIVYRLQSIYGLLTLTK